MLYRNLDDDLGVAPPKWVARRFLQPREVPASSQHGAPPPWVRRPRRQRTGLGELGDLGAVSFADVKSLGSQVLSLASQVGSAAQPILSRSTGFTDVGFRTVQDLANKVQGYQPPQQYWQGDYDVLSSALSALQAARPAPAPAQVRPLAPSPSPAAASPPPPPPPPPAPAPTSTPGSSVDAAAIASQTAVMGRLLQTVQASRSDLQSQVTAILQRTTNAGPMPRAPQSVQGVMSWYQAHPGPGPFATADRALLDGAVSAVAALLQTPPPAPATPPPIAAPPPPAAPVAAAAADAMHDSIASSLPTPTAPPAPSAPSPPPQAPVPTPAGTDWTGGGGEPGSIASPSVPVPSAPAPASSSSGGLIALGLVVGGLAFLAGGGGSKRK